MHNTCWKSGAVLIGISCVVIIYGCASTKMTSRINPQCIDQCLKRIMVSGNFADLEQQEIAENKLFEKMQRYPQLVCVKSADLFFPGKQYTQDDILRILNENSIDAVLILQPTNSGATSTYIPETKRTTGSVFVCGNTAYGSSTTRTTGGHSINKPWAHYEESLLSCETGDVIWYATAKSGGNAFAKWDDLIRSAAGKTIDRMVQDGVLGSVADE